MEIFRLSLLTKEECKAIEKQIFELKPVWIRRAKEANLPFYTLGQATYLDNPDAKTSSYYKKAMAQNNLLKEKFSPLYQKLLSALENTLKKPVAYETRLALPGFHIFLYHPAFKKPMASKHFDLQHSQHEWPYQSIDRNPLSFTLAITLPASGGGLNYWDLAYDDRPEWNQEIIEEAVSSLPMHFHPYKLGELTLHKGLFLHQIAPASDMTENDMRITLQGHALFCDGAWRLYW